MKKLTGTLVALAAITACKKTSTANDSAPATAQQKSAEGQGAWAAPTTMEQSTNLLFNFAQYVKENPKLAKLHGLVAEGNAYLAFGDKKLFRAETNLIVDAKADVDAEGKKGIYAQYFLDAYALGNKLPADGHAVDLGASATLSTPSTMEAHIRIMGDDKFKASVAGSFEQNFTRDIPFKLPFSPIPGVTLQVTGAVGGEIGLKGAIGARVDNAAQIVFIPRVALMTKVTGGIKLIEILKADAEGIVKLAEVILHSSANLGAIAASQFIYGNVGVEAGQLNAIDGKIDLVAGAGYDGILPGGLDKELLTKLVEKLGFGKLKELQWRYTLWDPEALIVKDIPGFGKSFQAFYKQPADRADCETKVAAIDSQITAHKASMEAILATQEGLEKKVTESSVKSLDEVLGHMEEYCK